MIRKSEAGTDAAQELPMSSASLDGVTANATDGASTAELKRGVISVDEQATAAEFPGAPEENSAGGFAGRPGGWER